MIYDCFTYYNEMELLELRLRTLSGVVDFFVLVEADRTFSGRKREFHFAANCEKFAAFAPQIIYIQVTDMPEVKNDWNLQHFQRNCILRGLSGCAPDDLVLVSDVDEIPHPDAIRTLLTHPEGRRLLQKHPVAFDLRAYFYYVNCARDRLMPGTVAILYKKLTQPELMRTIRDRAPRIGDAGWHFSYMGGPERILQKIEFLGHGKKPGANATSTMPTLELIRSSMESGTSDAHNDNGDHYRFLCMEDGYPAYMPTLVAKYPYLYRHVENAAAPAAVFIHKSDRLFYNFSRWYWYLLKCRLLNRCPY